MRWGSHVAHWGMVMVIIQVRKIGVFEEENKNTETVKYRCRHFYFTERIVRLIGTWWVYQAVNRELHPKHRSMGWGTYRPLEFTDGCGGAEHAASGDAADDAAETTRGFDEAPGELHGATRQTLSWLGSEHLRAWLNCGKLMIFHWFHCLPGDSVIAALQNIHVIEFCLLWLPKYLCTSSMIV